LSHMILYSAVIGIASALSGFAVATYFDTNIAGSMAAMSGVIFFMVLLFAPERGLLAKVVLRRWHKWDLGMQMLAVHLFQSEVTHADYTENIISHMKDHMLWDDSYTTEVIAQSLQEGLIRKDGERLVLTDYGREKARTALSKD